MSKMTYTTDLTVAAILTEENITAAGIAGEMIREELTTFRNQCGHMTVSELISIGSDRLCKKHFVGIATLKEVGAVMHHLGLPRYFK